MKFFGKIAVLALLAMSLAGCETFDIAKTAYTTLTAARVSQNQVYIARNAFGAAEVTATKYLQYCHAQTVKPKFCAKPNELAVARAIRSGRAARNELTAFMKAHPDAIGAKGLYDAVVSATDTVNQITAEYRGGAN